MSFRASGMTGTIRVAYAAAVTGAAWFLCGGPAAFGQAAPETASAVAPAAPAAAKAVSARCDYANVPYQYLDEKGVPAGFDVEILNAAARAAGIDIALAAGSWNENLDDLHAGRIDIVPGVGQTDAEKSRADLTVPYESVDYAVFYIAGSPAVSIEELAGRSVIVRRGDTVHEYLASRAPGANIVAVQSTREAVELLARGGHDCALLPKQVGSYLVQLLKKTNIIVGRTSIRVDCCLAVGKGAGDLQTRLAAGLDKVRAAGELDRIRDKWLGVYQKPPAVPAVDIVRYGVLWGGGLLLPILVVGLGVLLRRQRRKTRFKLEEMEREVWELKKNLTQVEEQKQSLISLLKNAPHGVAVVNAVDKDCEVAYVNEAATRITGYDMRDCENLPALVEKAFPDAEYRERLWQRWQRLSQGGFQEGGFTVAMTDKNGVSRRVDFQTGSLGSGNVILMFSDVTERYRMQEQQKLLDEQIRQSQKLEAMGQLAGGVAHDFNNLLTSIFGNAQLLQMEITEGEQADMIDQILKAAKRAGELTQQLLAYARKGKYQIVQVDIHQIIGEVVKLLEHSVNRLIQIKVELGAEKPMIMGTPTQIQGALLNLGVNARDAMPEGGSLTYRTRMINVDDEYRRGLSHDIPPGEYLAVEVVDTGVGMEKHVLERIFEPFFTTKAPGKGTGLGLAAVYGCVKNHHGSIRVTSEVGKGSCFTILFPTVGVKQIDEDAVEPDKSDVMVHGKGHIMLVDDEEDVRRITSRALRTLGYKVTPLTDGAEAIEFYKANHKEVDIVILDMVMPKVDGRTAFREMKKVNPEVKVLVVSGFAAETTARECMHEGALDFIAKPFWIGDLSQAVATYLGS